jgi:PPM family protein phosphatase
MTTAKPSDSPRVAPAPPLLQWSGLTHRGRIRANNEDAFLGLAVDGHEVHHLGKTGQAPLGVADLVFAVSDGMGGAKSGEFASRIAVDRIARLFPRAIRLAAAGIGGGHLDLLTELIVSIHHDLLKLGYSYEECAGMGATLSLGWFTPEWLYFAHVGDSRIYYVPSDGPMTQVTHDHTHVGWLQRKGELNEREARSHPRRTSLQQALGAGHQFIEPQIGAVGLRAGDRFLICSDGLIDGLWNWKLEELLRTPPGADSPSSHAQQIVEQSVESSGRDNTTAIVVELKTSAATPAP